MLTNQEREHIEEMADAANQGSFSDVHLLNRMLYEHTATLLAEIDRLNDAEDAIYRAITYRAGPKTHDLDPRALARFLAVRVAR
jgi:hypothetical protein